MIPFMGIIFYIPIKMALWKLSSITLIIYMLIYTQNCFSNSNKKNIKNINCLLYFILLLISFFEAAMFKITGNSFNYYFWKTFLNSNIIYSIRTYLLEYMIAILAFIIFIPIYWLFSNIIIKIQSGKIILIKVVLLIIVLVLQNNFHNNTIVSFIASYTNYYEINSYFNSKVKTDYIEIPTIDEVKATSGNNLILVYVESFNNELFNEERFPKLFPNLKKLATAGLLLNNIDQEPLHVNTTAGMEMSQCGRLTYLPVQEEKSYCIGNILNIADYYQTYINGSSLKFQDAGKLYTLMKYDEIWGFEQILESYPIYNKLKGGWGLLDEAIFDFAFIKYKELLQKNQPFVLTLLTQDSHDGISSDLCSSIDQYKGPGNNNDLLKSFHCDDYLIGQFINNISKLQKFNETIIIILGDHVMHETLVHINNNTNKIFGMILNSNYKGIYNYSMTLADIAPTILNLLNIETNAKFYDGINIFSEDLKLRNFNLFEAPEKLQKYLGYQRHNFIIEVQKHNIDDLTDYFINNKINPVISINNVDIYYKETESLAYKNIILFYNDFECLNIDIEHEIILHVTQENDYKTEIRMVLNDGRNFKKNIDNCYATTQFVLKAGENVIKQIEINIINPNIADSNNIGSIFHRTLILDDN